MAIEFSINGQPYKVNLSSLPADITLNTFIREHAGLSATKFMCQEGGCGVCTCVVTGKHPVTGEKRTWAVNSCLTLLNTCTNWEITTSEGLGSKRKGYHPIQKRLARLNGTQCGYCSPGFVMNMYALLKSKGGKVTMAEIENAFGGNICRCTGYRPILDAMKSFAIDSNIKIPPEYQDIEELGTSKTCPKTGNECNGSCHEGRALSTKTIKYDDGSQWFWATSLSDIFNAFEQLKGEKYILVAGNTAHGIYRRRKDIKHFIDVTSVPDLKSHMLSADKLVLGANISLSEAMSIFLEAAKQPGFEYCKQLWNHFDLIANVPVRNMGTLAGNLSIKHQHIEFPSDIFILFEAVDAQIVINETATVTKTISQQEYLRTPMSKKLINSFVLRPYPREKYLFDSYKIMPRAQNAHAYVNAAFFVALEKSNHKVISARICFGGINPNCIHAKTVEEKLIGRYLFDDQMVPDILNALKAELKADNILPDASPLYREKLAITLFYKFLLKHAPIGKIAKQLQSGGDLLKRPVSSGKQTYEVIQRNDTLLQPLEKLEGVSQTSGEAIFANDLPPQPKQLWAALVCAKKIGAKVTNIDASEALKMPGVVAFLTAKDIPGKNCVVGKDAFFFPQEEELLASGTIQFYNQPIGIIVAESNALSHEAAELVKLSYSGGSVEILPTLKDVLNSASSNRVKHVKKSVVKQLEMEDPFDYKGSGTLNMGLQYHFFLEPHTAIAVPTEGGITIYSATQWMDLVQTIVAEFLNMKNNEVQIVVRRIGGGYGGKGTRPVIGACVASLAAFKLNRPVRFVQSLESMMNSLGKRWACHSSYDFYATKDGKIVGLQNNFYEDAGYLSNETPMDHTELLAKNCYEFTNNFKLDGYMVFTDSPSNTACRAPGSVEGIALMENIIEHIAFDIGLDPVDVRKANLISGHKMNQMLPRFVKNTNYRSRKQAVKNFNKENRWRKKGMGIAIMEYHMGYFGQFPATLAIYHGDGTVVISHGGIEMGQGMNTKIAQVAAFYLNIPLELVRIEASTTINGANSMVTGGSIGSESICYAVRKCCATINERLKPVKEALKDATWPELIEEAYNRKINLIVSDDFKEGDMQPYTVCALGLIEVEVDILTGNYLVNRVDIVEDAGESLNPTVDIGQIEGAFIMGLGYWTTEYCVVDSKTGELKTNRTWNYKPPGAKDIPIDFRIELLPNSPNPAGFMRSKATGEPAICLGIAVAFAIQEAIQSARNDAGTKKSWVTLNAPMTPEYIVLNAGTEIDMLKLH